METSNLTWILLVLLVLVAENGCFGQVRKVSDEYQTVRHNDKCVPITMDLCNDIQYNMTIFPNLLKHQTQDEANSEIKSYEMLVKVKCSPDFKFFLCTLFAPVCTMLDEPIPPCRHLCLSAKTGCEDLMKKFGYPWPEIFNCDKFPGPNEMCVGENTTRSAPVSSTVSPPEKTLECPHTMKVLSKSSYRLQIANSSIQQCSLPCESDEFVPIFGFTAPERGLLRLTAWLSAVVCLVCTLFTVVTFLIDIERFEFPERAILYMGVCYFFVSVTYLVGTVAGGPVSCGALSSTQSALVTQGVDNFACSAVAFINFYFSTAAAVWWFCLCFAWFLVTTLKWGEAPVGQVFGSYFSLLAWGGPAVAAIAVLVTNSVDGDMFTGLCSVGNLQPQAMLRFVAIPQAALIVSGFFLFGCGFISILRIRSYIKGQKAAPLGKLEAASGKISRLMIRITMFAALYMMASVAYCVFLFYQAVNMDSWLTSWYGTRCLHLQRGSFGFTQPRELCPINQAALTNESPDLLMFCGKYVAQLSVGVACAVWTINGKTFNSYGDFYARVFLGRSRVPTRQS
ncbi:unnamed protein product [Bursaphelenchus xylophilus]|uniref:(pine wood nematode) hypothetical protein n=1 Tax=Bursaphelenchus xylophilus TaxID=6326 RepID=A0A1I7S7X7_BURXY|nr:unnamed protein product [Bursaphelenchus xylophilus]CAG9087199.1 unnamed protein product [Bursaphelenchus xylophilus]